MRRRLFRVSVFALCAVALTTVAASQPVSGERPRRAPSALREREQVRRQLEEQLAEVQEREHAVRAALRMLDRGAGIEAVQARAREVEVIDEAMKTAILEIIEESNPRLHRRINRFIDADPQRAEAILRRYGPRIRPIIALRSSAPELYKLKIDELRLAARISLVAFTFPTEPREGEEKKSELRGLVADRFDLRVEIERLEFEGVERRIELARASASDRISRRDELVDREVERLIADSRALESEREDGGLGKRRNRR